MADPLARLGSYRVAALLVSASAFGLLIGWPLARLAAEAVGAGWQPIAIALQPAGRAAIANSLWVAVASTILSLGVGVGLALLTEHTAVRHRRLLQIGIAGPLLIPDFVAALGWTRAYGPAGLLDRLTGLQLPGLYGPLGVVLVLAVGHVPLAYLLVVAGMRARDEPDLERAARMSGASGGAALRTVSLPLLWPVLAAAGGLLFAMTMNAFGTPAVLGRPAGFATMTTQIYGDLAFSSSDAAFDRVLGMSSLLVVLVVVAVVVTDRLRPRQAERGEAVGARGQARPARRLAVVLAWGVVLFGTLLPLLALLLTALTRAVGLPPLPEHLTLANFGRAVDSRTAPAIMNSVVLAGLAAAACVLLGSAAAVARGRFRRIPGPAVVGFAVPGSVLAVAVFLAFGSSLRDTLLIILLAYVAKLWALAERPIAARIERLPAAASFAAHVHGADAPTAFRTVTLPLLAPAMLVGGLLVFVVALHEVTISILLYGPRSMTLAVAILNLQQLGDPTLTSALAILLTALVAVCALPLLVLRRYWPASAAW